MQKTALGDRRRPPRDLARRRVMISLLGAAVPILIAPGPARAFYHGEPSPSGATSQPASGDVVVVGMTDRLRYVPAEIRIKPGDTVEWQNQQSYPHTITADPARVANPANVELPAETEAFDSGRVRGGQTWRRTFTVPGVYRYVCLPHEGQGMLGTVIVG